MATQKKDSQSFEFQIEEIKKKIGEVDIEIKKTSDRAKKENELIEYHKNLQKKYLDDIQKLTLQKKGLRMDMMDIRADMAEVDRDKYFEDVMAAVEKNTPKAESKNNVDGASAPSTSEDKDISKKDEAVHDTSSDHNITPLDKARAEFAKKNPSGISIAERSKQK